MSSVLLNSVELPMFYPFFQESIHFFPGDTLFKVSLINHSASQQTCKCSICMMGHAHDFCTIATSEAQQGKPNFRNYILVASTCLEMLLSSCCKQLLAKCRLHGLLSLCLFWCCLVLFPLLSFRFACQSILNRASWSFLELWLSSG